jgi:hypothetical protein
MSCDYFSAGLLAGQNELVGLELGYGVAELGRTQEHCKASGWYEGVLNQCPLHCVYAFFASQLAAAELPGMRLLS